MKALALLCCLLAGAAGAQEKRMLGDGEAEAYRAVGRLNIYGARFCSATLISETLVLTAAHCLYSPVLRRLVRVEGLKFVAGQRRDQEAAVRGVTRMAVLPEYRFDPQADVAHVASDIALLELEAPVPAALAPAIGVGAMDLAESFDIVSYSRERAWAPSIAGPCDVRTSAGGVMAMLACAVNSGASGGPVLSRGPEGTRLVAVVSAMGQDFEDQDVALTVIAAPRMAALRAALRDAPAAITRPLKRP